MNRDEYVIAKLTESQKTCLQLVARGMSSKEIARVTELSPFTVDNYIARAVSELGADNRRMAARMVQEAQLKKLEYENSQFPQPQTTVIDVPSATSAADEGAQPPAVSAKRKIWRLFDLPKMGGGYHDLNGIEKFTAAARVAFVSSLFALGVTTLLLAAIRLLNP